MATCAKQVVDAIAALQAGNALTGANVFTDRLWPPSSEALPDMLVFAGREIVKANTVNYPRVQEHQLEVFVIGRVRAVTGIDDALDAMALEVVGNLFDTLEHKRLGSLKVTVDEIARDRVMPEPDSAEFQKTDFAVGKVVHTLLAKFHTRENAPEAFA